MSELLMYDVNTKCKSCGAINGEVPNCWRCGREIKGWGGFRRIRTYSGRVNRRLLGLHDLGPRVDRSDSFPCRIRLN